MTESRVWKLTPGASVLAPGTWASFDGAPPAPPPAPPPDPDPDPDPDYVVTGTLDPDATGNYFDNGDTNNGEPVYEHEDGGFFIWNGGTNYHINSDVGNVSTFARWQRAVASGIEGEWTETRNGATGTATVAAGT